VENTAQFVGHLNVARFVDKLRLEHDRAMRASLQRLLLEELSKLGSNLEQLCSVQHKITEGRVELQYQKALVKSLRANQQDVRLAESTLSNLLEIQRIFEQYRQLILNGLAEMGRN